ncbi:MAG: chemotaxis-specific protein-glutamate methyltransferase CheB [Campylobacterales bacterium]|nr:chemotaxis-specific protein-glutamate methyltransferase CheB [Campylobacterales bacterium]
MAKMVLIVDDSALVRKQLGELIESAGYEIDFAKNGQEAVDKASKDDYSVITMDINMPIMDGLTAVKKIMEVNPTPILMISSLTTEDAPITIEAMEFGAIDYVAKPGTFNVNIEENGQEILRKIRSVSRISKDKLKSRAIARHARREISRDNTVSKSVENKVHTDSVVLIGSSTGGPGLIEEICSWLPEDYPHAVCVVQHMPEKFTQAFAERLNRASKVPVKESSDNDELYAGHVYIAKGGTHLHFRKKVSGKITIKHGNSTEKRFFTPSVDEMYISALDVFNPSKVLAVILTGIGDDGADGMVKLKKAGVFTVAESEDSATVYGMPKEAFLRGGTCEVLPFSKILRKITSHR